MIADVPVQNDDTVVGFESNGDSKGLLFVVEGRPKPLKRHRTGGGGRTFDPSSVAKRDFIYKLLSQYGPQIARRRVYKLCVEFSFALPSRFSRKEREANLGTLKRIRPDLSNLIKFIEDALEGILLVNDASIGEIHARKVYGETEYTAMRLYYHEPDEPEVMTVEPPWLPLDTIEV